MRLHAPFPLDETRRRDHLSDDDPLNDIDRTGMLWLGTCGCYPEIHLELHGPRRGPRSGPRPGPRPGHVRVACDEGAILPGSVLDHDDDWIRNAERPVPPLW
ncbi:MAG: hypothetical protein AAFV86_24345 [Pseudomonadota bacterium]